MSLESSALKTHNSRPITHYPYYLLLLQVELLPGFLAVVGSHLLGTLSLPYAVFWLFELSGVIGLALSSLALQAGPARWWKRAIPLAGGAILAALPALFLWKGWASGAVFVLLLVIAYWRGIAVSGATSGFPPTHEIVQQRFLFGFALLCLAILWISGRGSIFQHSIVQLVGLAGIAFVVVSMLALAMARAEWTEERGGSTQVIVLAVGLPLVVVLLVSVAALEVFSLDIAGRLTAGTVRMGHISQPFLAGVGNALLVTLRIVLSPILWVAESVHSHFHGALPPHRPRPVRPLPPGSTLRPSQAHAGDLTWLLSLGAALVVLVLTALAIFIWRTLPPRERGRRGRTQRASRSKLWSPSGFWPALLAWLRGLLARGAETVGQRLKTAGRRISGPRYPSDPVRRMYSQLLRRAGARGLPRPGSVTPEEFLIQLEARWPEGGEHFSALTEAYVERRYGDLPFSPGQVAELNRHWQAARVLVRQPKEL